MNFMLGDIVEKDTLEINDPSDFAPPTNPSISKSKFKETNSASKRANHAFSGIGFPEVKRLSAFKSMQRKKNDDDKRENGSTARHSFNSGNLRDAGPEPQKYKYQNSNSQENPEQPLTEQERIHLENIQYLSTLTHEQKVQEREELMNSMDPKVLQGLLGMFEKKEKKLKEQNSKETPVNFEENKIQTEEKDENKQRSEYEGFGDEGLTVAGDWIGGFNKQHKNNTEKSVTSVTGFDDEGVNKALGVNAEEIIENQVEKKKKNERGGKKSVKIANKVAREKIYEEDLDAIAPPNYQINANVSEQPINESTYSSLHFPTPPPNSYEPLDINSPDFSDKLHEKYFPDLPRDVKSLEWTQPLKPVSLEDTIINTVSDLRFDFSGDLVISQPGEIINTTTGLYHHSEASNLKGYSLKELAHLSRSSVPGQRCLSIRTLGRILYKLGKEKEYYLIEPEFVDEDGEIVEFEENAKDKEGQKKFREMIWDLIKELKVIETIQEFSEDSNLSAKNYAVEALWMWRRGMEKDSDIDK